ncbi:MAG: class I SAM-dependent methyltransferase [Methanolinea sp.]|nr:class I SAM-dependent methyltransferase [Methanolinea sp.]
MENRFRHAWDREYTRKGRIFGRTTQDYPEILPGERFLDVGCGDCRAFRALCSAKRPNISAYYIGLDHSRPALSICRPLVSLMHNMHIVCADATSMPFPDESFDIVFLVHVLGHVLLKDRKRMVREAVRVVRRGGRIYIRVFSLSDFRAGDGIEVEDGTFIRKTGICTHFFSQGEVRDLFSPLEPVFLDTISWTMGAGNKRLIREEIQGMFKPGKIT